jgi:WhiB family transcriptional regulator, redox-sensing transcriptional regulator
MEALESFEFWREDAACFGASGVDFFADDPLTLGRAKALCAGCPVRDDCLAFAIETNQSQGVWGGYEPTERARLRRVWLRDLRRAS